MENIETARDKLIDELLGKLYKDFQMPIRAYLAKKDLVYITHDLDRYVISIIDKMNREDLIIRSQSHVKEISDKGKEVFESGGWLKYLERQRIREEKEEERNHWNSQLTKWNVKTRWWPLGISVASLIVSVVAFTITTSQDKVDKKEKGIEKSNTNGPKTSGDSLDILVMDSVTINK